MRIRWQVCLLLTLLTLAQAGYGAADKKDKSDKHKDDSSDSSSDSKNNTRNNGKNSTPKADDPVVWRDRVTPGAGIVISLKRPVGKSLIYDGTLDRSQESENTYHEHDDFLLNVLNAQRDDDYDLMALWRHFTDRKRTEKLENGKTTNPILQNSDDLINLGPNYKIVGTLRCYPFKETNQLAYRSQQELLLLDGTKQYGSILSEDEDKVIFLTATDKVEIKRSKIASTKVVPFPHILLNETPNYFFPIFSARTVSPGDTWKFKTPVIIPLEQATGYVIPTQFELTYVGRLREVRGAAGSQVAVVDYQVGGVFDTEDHDNADRFPAGWRDENHIVHKVSGEGSCSVDVEKGRLLEKSETFTINLYAKVIAPQEGKKPKEIENKAVITSTYSIKLVPPGTKLKSGAIVPEYDK